MTAMHDDEFTTRLYADPWDAALQHETDTDPATHRRAQLEDIRLFDRQLRERLHAVEPTPELAARLMGISDTGVSTLAAWRSPWTVGWALAAAIVLTIGGIIRGQFVQSATPTPSELAVSESVMAHVYHELASYDANADLGLTQANLIMAAAGGRLQESSATHALSFRFLKRCFVLPNSPSAHLVVAGEKGMINIIVMQDAAVSQAFDFGDERFKGTVVPLESGTLFLLAEQGEELGSIADLLSESIEWII